MVWVPPAIPHTTNKIINKTIVHSDTVLPLKELGENIIANEINNISKSDITNLLNTIFECNNDVVFNTIQYSEELKRIWIYTNKKIDITKWENRNIKNYSVSNNEDLIKYFDDMVDHYKKFDEYSNDEYCSLDTVFKYHYKKYWDFEEKERLLKIRLGSACGKDEILGRNYMTIHDVSFDYDNNILEIEFCFRYSEGFNKIYIGNNNGDIYIKSSDYYDDQRILMLGFDSLKELYELYKNERSFKDDSKYWYSSPLYRRKILGTDFNIMLSPYNAIIYIGFKDKCIVKEARKSYYKYSNFNSQREIEYLDNNIKKISKCLLVKIDDLPQYLKKMVLEEKKEILEQRARDREYANRLFEEEQRKRELKEQIEKEKQERLEAKKKKREELKKKLFPFIKSKDKDMFTDDFSEKAPVKTIGTKPNKEQ